MMQYDVEQKSVLLVIEQSPLQLYCSALVFAPEKSIIRETFKKFIPSWIKKTSKAPAYWNVLLQTLEGHSESVNSVAFSPDGKLLPVVYIFNYWIVEGDTNILWLPPEY